MLCALAVLVSSAGSAEAPRESTEELAIEPSGFDLDGATVLDDEAREGLFAPFRGRRLTSDDLLELVAAVRAHYSESGWETTEVELPDQDLEDGRVEIRVHEGRIDAIEIVGATAFQPAYYRTRLARAGRAPLHVPTLHRELERLQADPSIERVSAVLERTAPGRATLRVEVVERPPFSASARFSNHRSPSVGSPGAILGFGHASLLGFGDRFQVQGQLSEGIRDFGLRYELPLVVVDTRIFAAYRRGKADIVEGDFEGEPLAGRFESISLGLRHPLHASPSFEIWAELLGDWRRGASTLFGRPYCFQADLRDCEPSVAVLRTSQELIYRGRSRAASLRSTASFGLDALGASEERDSSDRDGEFVAWLLQLQWLERLPEIESLAWLDGSELAGRFDLQLANDPLVAVEQFAVGGGTSVRGYRENQLVRDAGLVASAELRVPVVRSRFGVPILAVAPFIDVGRAWDRSLARADGSVPDDAEDRRETIASGGVALRFALGESWSGEISWAHSFQRVDPEATGLQGEGVYFEVVWNVF